ncbi:spermidine synthase [Lichtheimia corymbifera JMRC:FSU:9682]|uniref:Spermidine synthase n=1 Tax=Lichtheimia corymbifera JMRC:FSU:9682 TaxID=1263082 RepID=A0A068S519_9FUNG|nr:spermidine synthase [Lichtheimia corymbifera JMRC:FSU:9682]
MTKTNDPLVKDGWFMEKNEMWPGQAAGLQVEEVLFHDKSEYQDVMVFRSSHHGNVLVLDNVIQATERDEFSYQEMITHLAMNSHPNPKQVLVIGGGDGGVLREVVKHPEVEGVTLVEIDEMVLRVAKEHMGEMAIGFDHPKVSVVIQDGVEFLRDKSNIYDVVIVDCSDPDGPAEGLFSYSFYEMLKRAMTDNGIFITQAEVMWLDMETIRKAVAFNRTIYPQVRYSYACVPSYPTGQIGFIVCSKDPTLDPSKPLRCWSEDEENKLCRYYSAAIHKASFILPQFAKRVLES